MSDVVLLTGAASGIGRHLVTCFSKRGARVLATDIDEAGMFAASEEERWDPSRIVRRRLDVTSANNWEEALAALHARWGRLDVALLGAGYLKPGLVHELDLAEIGKHLDINAKGVMLGLCACAKPMVAAGAGHLVAIGSLASVAPVPGLSLYSASKFAVRGFCLSAAEELRSRGVSVSLMLPDAVETPMLDLQRDYEEAALTFSGVRSLTVHDLERALFDVVLPKKPLEIYLPGYRGALAQAASLAPSAARFVLPLLKALGRRKQRAASDPAKNSPK